LERTLLKVKHDPAMLLLDLTLGEVLDVPSDSRKTRIPRHGSVLCGISGDGIFKYLYLSSHLSVFFSAEDIRATTPASFRKLVRREAGPSARN
jgi:hypothetical protein